MSVRINGKSLEFTNAPEEPPTRAEWDAASPYAQGYISYTYAAHPGSDIPADSPYSAGTPDHAEFERGQQAAVLAAQGSEE